ncbi:MAG: lipoyl(octanoyl) transferase LipB [Dehalococcoidia bacterium]|nr:lipoyl(octanoyl) transferase LipB [Dehalococcoidia bacterium]
MTSRAAARGCVLHAGPDLAAILALAAARGAAPAVADIGRVEYGHALEMQRQLRDERMAGRCGDLLLLLEHPPTITLGRRAEPSELLATPEELERRGIALVETDRGGRTTYHGPGQVVGYAIVDVAQRGGGVHGCVRDLEQVVIDALNELGVGGERIAGLTGVWVNGAKIAAIGLHVRHWVTNHGFALNVSRDSVEPFGLIVPCGIPDRPVTCLEEALGRPVATEAVKGALARAFAARFIRNSTAG